MGLGSVLLRSAARHLILAATTGGVGNVAALAADVADFMDFADAMDAADAVSGLGDGDYNYDCSYDSGSDAHELQFSGDDKADPNSLASDQYPYEDKIKGEAYRSQSDWISNSNPASNQDALNEKLKTLQGLQGSR